MIRIYIRMKIRDLLLLLGIVGLIISAYFIYKRTFVETDFEITDELAGNIFPSFILSVATTDADIIAPSKGEHVGTPRYGGIAIQLKSKSRNSRVRIEIAETPFSEYSVSEFILPQKWTNYTVYPEMVWKYEALRNNKQPTPVSVVATVTVNDRPSKLKVRTFSMRSLNECLLGYYSSQEGNKKEFINTNILFAAYVNEDNPQIDKLLREALNARLVNRFLGYQKDSATVVRQVYALWNVLQRRSFRYSSISKSSLSSNMIVSQRVRTFDDAINSSQINCVDGSALFASLMRAINIDPVLIQVPGHMFVGFYTDKQHKNVLFFETTMIGNIELADYFPDENIDSTMQGKTQNQMSRITFDKSIQYATEKFNADSNEIRKESPGYMYLDISNAVRRKVQPIGR